MTGAGDVVDIIGAVDRLTLDMIRVGGDENIVSIVSFGDMTCASLTVGVNGMLVASMNV